MILGVRVPPGRKSATVQDLAAARLLVPAPGFPDGVSVPAPEVLAAHVLVHGVAQHGLAPHAYPGFRLLADLHDLGFGGPGGGELAQRAGTLVARDVPWTEVEAVRDLCRSLAAGELAPLAGDPRGSGQAALLHHLLAGALDPNYRRSLRFAALTRPLTDRPPLVGALRALYGALVPGRVELEALYGRRGGRLGRLGRRLRRPLDLAARAARSAASAAALRRREGGSGATAKR
jgi:hypothetical protein